MRKNAFLEELERRLQELSCPVEQSVRNIREVAEHREDLRLAALAEGVSETEAETVADARLGNPRQLAAQLVSVARQSRWWGRHPVLSFCVMAILLGALGFSSTGCTSQKANHERGWIGGEYKPARKSSVISNQDVVNAVPKEMEKSQTGGILILALGTNAPARWAGLCEGDLIAEVNHRRVSTMKNFRQEIDRNPPGSSISVIAYRDGKRMEFSVPVGREIYRKWHDLAVGLFVCSPDLWPDPSFSLILLGYHSDRETRQELDSVENRYLKSCNPSTQPNDPGWSAWAGIISVGAHDTVLKQERVGGAPPQ